MKNKNLTQDKIAEIVDNDTEAMAALTVSHRLWKARVITDAGFVTQRAAIVNAAIRRWRQAEQARRYAEARQLELDASDWMARHHRAYGRQLTYQPFMTALQGVALGK